MKQFDESKIIKKDQSDEIINVNTNIAKVEPDVVSVQPEQKIDEPIIINTVENKNEPEVNLVEPVVEVKIESKVEPIIEPVVENNIIEEQKVEPIAESKIEEPIIKSEIKIEPEVKVEPIINKPIEQPINEPVVEQQLELKVEAEPKQKRQYTRRKKTEDIIIENKTQEPKKVKEIEIERPKENQMPVFNVDRINGRTVIKSKKMPQFNYTGRGYRNNGQVDRSMTKEQLKILKINVNKEISEISLDISVLTSLINSNNGDIVFYENKLNFLKNELTFLYQKKAYIESLLRN